MLFVTITTEPNTLVGKVHDRMPAILPPQQEKAWLDPEQSQTALERILAPSRLTL
ncbi:MAG: SOS response-associated peptidase [Acidobacteria bacterium]|nr:SOS response-associated peptidase [Acidobacteriota bacterium]